MNYMYSSSNNNNKDEWRWNAQNKRKNHKNSFSSSEKCNLCNNNGASVIAYNAIIKENVVALLARSLSCRKMFMMGFNNEISEMLWDAVKMCFCCVPDSIVGLNRSHFTVIFYLAGLSLSRKSFFDLFLFIAEIFFNFALLWFS